MRWRALCASVTERDKQTTEPPVTFTKQNQSTMDGILYLTDERNKKRFVQIDLDRFDADYIEDLLDGLVAEARKDEETVTLEEARKQLREAGKLDG